jgi:hypothetical protein
MRTGISLLAVAGLALQVTACGSSGGSGGGASASTAASPQGPTSTTPGSTSPALPNQPKPTLVGSAGGPGATGTGPGNLTGTVAPGPALDLPAATQAALDQALAGTWTAIKPTVDADLAKEVQKLAGTTHGSLTINALSIVKSDLASPPRLTVTPATNGETVEILAPEGTWELALQGSVGYAVKIGSFALPLVGANLTVDVQNIRATETLTLDTTDPTLPVCTSAGKLDLTYDLVVSTPSALVNVVLTVLRPLIDSLLGNVIQSELAKYDALLASLVGQPQAAKIWGLGAPARAPFGQQPDLEKATLSISNDIQSVQTPYGGIVTAYMSDPTYGQGTPLHWEGYADSAIWTGHYLAGESFRYAVTKDPLAEANAIKALAAIEDMLDAETPGGGHLARCVVPASAPDAATLLQNATSFTSTVRGQSVVCLGNISRDQYLGIMHGLGCAYDSLDDPTQQQLAGSLVTRVVDYLVANDWVAMRHDNVTMSAPFIQSPEKMVAFTALAAHVDPAKYQALRDQVGQLAWVIWVFDMTGVVDPLTSYYKWNLGEGAMYEAMRLETDANRFMALSRAHAIERRAIGHHENAYFQTIDSAMDPTLAATLAPEILDELRRFVSRGRRDFTVTNSTDPTVAQGTYTSPLSLGGTATTTTEALYPIAVEKRPSTDYLWQRDPFALDGVGDPQRQAPGVDLVLPYWMARYYKLVP